MAGGFWEWAFACGFLQYTNPFLFHPLKIWLPAEILCAQARFVLGVRPIFLMEHKGKN